MRSLAILRNEKGSFLALAIILVVLLTFSGLAFLHADFLEKRMSMEERWDQKAFYLAQAGIERAREAFKISMVGGLASWTPVLNGTTAGYPTDASPDPLLCPDVTRGCVIPPFQTTTGNPSYVTANGQAITAPDMPFSAADDPGSYSVRAFNNAAEAGITDVDKIITLRAVGNIHNHIKVIQVDVLATSDLNLINCIGATTDPCPDLVNGNPVIDPMDGREPESSPSLPQLIPPLADSSNFYRNPANFPGLAYKAFTGDITLTTSPNASKPEEVLITDNSFYYTAGSVLVKDTAAVNDRIVIVSLKDVLVKTGVLTNSIIAASEKVQLQGGATFSSPSTYPAIISGTSVKADSNVTIYGNIFSSGIIDLNPVNVHGALIGSVIKIQGASGTLFTDDDNLAYYAVMDGFTYPEGSWATSVGSGTWKEIK